MRGDLDAVLEGCLEGGADEIVICDAHDRGDNLGVAGLPAGVSLISGGGTALSMMAGVEAGFDAAFMVGYHARAGTARATLAHTYLFEITDVVVCGGPDGDLAIGELGLNAAVAGAFGTPLAFRLGRRQAGRRSPGSGAGRRSGRSQGGARLVDGPAARARRDARGAARRGAPGPCRVAAARARLERSRTARELRPPRLVRWSGRLPGGHPARRLDDRDPGGRLAQRLRHVRRLHQPSLGRPPASAAGVLPGGRRW